MKVKPFTRQSPCFTIDSNITNSLPRYENGNKITGLLEYHQSIVEEMLKNDLDKKPETIDWTISSDGVTIQVIGRCKGISSVDWGKRSIVLQEMKPDIIGYLLDVKRRYKAIYERDLASITCSGEIREEVIKAFAKWSLCVPGKDRWVPWHSFAMECMSDNSIYLDGDRMGFNIV